MSRSTKLLTFLTGASATCLLVAITPPTAADPAADEVFTVSRAIPLPGTPPQSLVSFDISDVDPTLGLYALGDRTNKAVDLIQTNNLAAGVTQLKENFAGATGNNDTSGPDGVVFVNHKEVWVGDAPSRFWIIQVPPAAPNAQVFTVPNGTNKRVDEMCWDPDHNLVMMANNADDPPFVSIYSTTGPVLRKQIIFDKTHLPNFFKDRASNGIEQCQYNHRRGKFFLAIPEIDGPGDNSVAGGVAVVDPISFEVEGVFPVNHQRCAGPQGMAIGPDPQILLGCNTPSGGKVLSAKPDDPGNHQFRTVIVDDQNPSHIIKAFRNESGADMVWFNPGNGHYFLARSNAGGGAGGPEPNQLLGVIDAIALKADPSVSLGVQGAPNNHSVAADPVTNLTIVPIGRNKDVCSQAPGAPAGIDATGCFAVFKAPSDGDDCIAEGAPVMEVNDEGPSFLRGKCRGND